MDAAGGTGHRASTAILEDPTPPMIIHRSYTYHPSIESMRTLFSQKLIDLAANYAVRPGSETGGVGMDEHSSSTAWLVQTRPS